MYTEDLHAFCTVFVEFNPGSTAMFKCGLEHKWYLPKDSKRVGSFYKTSQWVYEQDLKERERKKKKDG